MYKTDCCLLLSHTLTATRATVLCVLFLVVTLTSLEKKIDNIQSQQKVH